MSFPFPSKVRPIRGGLHPSWKCVTGYSQLFVSYPSSPPPPFADLLGAQRPHVARAASIASLLIVTVMATGSFTLLLVFRRTWATLFSNDAEVGRMAEAVIPLLALFQLTDGASTLLRNFPPSGQWITQTKLHPAHDSGITTANNGVLRGAGRSVSSARPPAGCSSTPFPTESPSFPGTRSDDQPPRVLYPRSPHRARARIRAAVQPRLAWNLVRRVAFESCPDLGAFSPSVPRSAC